MESWVRPHCGIRFFLSKSNLECQGSFPTNFPATLSILSLTICPSTLSSLISYIDSLQLSCYSLFTVLPHCKVYFSLTVLPCYIAKVLFLFTAKAISIRCSIMHCQNFSTYIFTDNYSLINTSSRLFTIFILYSIACTSVHTYCISWKAEFLFLQMDQVIFLKTLSTFFVHTVFFYAVGVIPHTLLYSTVKIIPYEYSSMQLSSHTVCTVLLHCRKDFST